MKHAQRPGKLFGVILLVLSSGLLLFPFAGEGKFCLPPCLQDMLHFPCMAIMTWGAAALGFPRRKTLPCVILLVVLMALVGAAFEWIQPLFGRSASLDDWILGVGGSFVAGILLVRHPRHLFGKQYIRMILVVTVCVTSFYPLLQYWLVRRWAKSAYPLLASFEKDWEKSLWNAQGCEVKIVREHSSDGLHALAVSTFTPNPYPGIFLPVVHNNWMGANRLCADLYWDGSGRIGIWIRLDDENSSVFSSRFQKYFDLSIGDNRLCVDREDFSVSASGRPMNLERILLLGFFFDTPPRDGVLYIDNVRLELTDGL